MSPLLGNPAHRNFSYSDLQRIGDLQEIVNCCTEIDLDLNYDGLRFHAVCERIQLDLDERLIAAKAQANELAAAGNWTDAEYIYNIIARPNRPCLEPGDPDVMTLSVTMNENLGNFTTAMEIQERVVSNLAGAMTGPRRGEDIARLSMRFSKQTNLLVAIYRDLDERLHAMNLHDMDNDTLDLLTTSIICRRASRLDDFGLVASLIQKKLIRAQTSDQRAHALQIAARHNAKNFVSVLSCSLAIPNYHGPNESWQNESALHIAAQHGNISVAKVLIERGTDRDAKDIQGRTPLYLACLFGHHVVVSLLLLEGADAEARTAKGDTPLDYACIRGDDSLIARLLLAAVRLKNESSS